MLTLIMIIPTIFVGMFILNCIFCGGSYMVGMCIPIVEKVRKWANELDDSHVCYHLFQALKCLKKATEKMWGKTKVGGDILLTKLKSLVWTILEWSKLLVIPALIVAVWSIIPLLFLVGYTFYVYPILVTYLAMTIGAFWVFGAVYWLCEIASRHPDKVQEICHDILLWMLAMVATIVACGSIAISIIFPIVGLIVVGVVAWTTMTVCVTLHYVRSGK